MLLYISLAGLDRLGLAYFDMVGRSRAATRQHGFARGNTSTTQRPGVFY